MPNPKNPLPFETMHFNYINTKEIRPKVFKKARTRLYWKVSAQLKSDLMASPLTLQSFPIGILTHHNCKAGSNLKHKGTACPHHKTAQSRWWLHSYSPIYCELICSYRQILQRSLIKVREKILYPSGKSHKYFVWVHTLLIKE